MKATLVAFVPKWKKHQRKKIFIGGIVMKKTGAVGNRGYGAGSITNVMRIGSK